MLPDVPVPFTPAKTRERNERLPRDGAIENCLICAAPLTGKRIGLNVDLATNSVMDPNAPARPDSGVLWVGATCARKVPAAYRIPWKVPA